MIIYQANSGQKLQKPIRTIKKSKPLKNPTSEISRIEDYYSSLRDIGISLPHYFKSKIVKNRIITEWSDWGEPMGEVIKKANSAKVLDILNNILNINHWAFLNKTPLYPSINSYSLTNKEIIFVDFLNNHFRRRQEPTKKLINSLILFGLIQKIALPVREIISIRAELQDEIISVTEKYLKQWQMTEFLRDLKIILNYHVPKKIKKKEKINLNLSSGYENIFYFNHDQKIISLSPKIIWTPFLLYRDMEICKKMGLVFNEF